MAPHIVRQFIPGFMGNVSGNEIGNWRVDGGMVKILV